MCFYKFIFKFFLSKIDAELSHNISMKIFNSLYKIGFFKIFSVKKYNKKLEKNIMNLSFPSPIGLAAGFDKNGKYIESLSSLGFGYIEIGTVTSKQQSGHSKPRLFRLYNKRALLNKMGFNNDGADLIAKRLKNLRLNMKLRKKKCPIIGVNIGKIHKKTNFNESIDDYLISIKKLAPVADYLVINLSSPNTTNLINLQNIKFIESLVKKSNVFLNKPSSNIKIPLFIKLSPDLSYTKLKEIVKVIIKLKISGIVATNTSLINNYNLMNNAKFKKYQSGGLSGPPIKKKSLEILKFIKNICGSKLILISVGGIENNKDIAERLHAGADLVQIYTSFIYKGPFLIRYLNKNI